VSDTELIVSVDGRPAPQGSKKMLHGQMLEANDRARPWRNLVLTAVQAARAATRHSCMTGPVQVDLDFRFEQPRSVRGLRGLYPMTRSTGDLDKLCRAALDGLRIAGAYIDDSQVVALTAVTRYVETARLEGATLNVRSAVEGDRS